MERLNNQKLHFINCINYENVGDWLASPLNYFAEYFTGRYNIVVHDASFIKWNDIEPCDAVILGGGGLLENEPVMQEYINRILDSCGCVIAWSVGFHRRSKEPCLPEVDYSRFALISIRDYDYPVKLDYVPCVTCLLPQLQKKRTTKRDIGIINHTSIPITGTKFDTIDNAAGIDAITDFIAESDSILTSSYHGAYWSLLMKKKTVISHVWANKFEYFERKPAILTDPSAQGLMNSFSSLDPKSYDGWLEECIEHNLAFFEKVKDLLEGYIKNTNSAETIVNIMKQQAWATSQLNTYANELMRYAKLLADEQAARIDKLEGKR